MRHMTLSTLGVLALWAIGLFQGFQANADERVVEGSALRAVAPLDTEAAVDFDAYQDEAVYEGRMGISYGHEESWRDQVLQPDWLDGDLELLDAESEHKQVEIANCNDVDIRITNSTVTSSGAYVSVKIRYVKFYNVERATLYTEDLTDTVLKHNYYVWFWDQDLEDSQNYTISYWVVYYNLVYADGTVSNTTYSKTVNTTDIRCANDMDVYLTI